MNLLEKASPKMNVYCVKSEELYHHGDSMYDPPEYYCIVGLVVAKSPSQAKYLIWQTDSSFDKSDITEMPKFQCRLSEKDVNLPIGVIEDSWKEKYDKWWWTDDQ